MLTCQICTEKPVQLYCSTCEKMTCLQCLQRSARARSICPFCLSTLSYQALHNLQPFKILIDKFEKKKLSEKHIHKAFLCSSPGPVKSNKDTDQPTSNHPHMIIDPQSCESCKANFCNDCVKDKDTCPSCGVRGLNFRLTNIHRGLM